MTQGNPAPPRARRHLMGLAGMSGPAIEEILDLADHFKEVTQRRVKKVPALRGILVVNLFAEASTRTRSSFEIAEKRLSADVLNFSASTSSLAKGETLLDTAKNLEAMAPDILVVRHGAAGVPGFLAKHLNATIINAGDGWHEHPTQALLDAMTLRENLGPLAGRRVAIIGDITHSRVARSNIFGLTALGVDVQISGPPTMVPTDLASLGVTVHQRVETAIEGADAVMMLRIQKERMGPGMLPDDHEYLRFFGLTPDRLRGAAPNALVMHPGPMNRGVEIVSAVADGPQSVILDQVANGVAVRMAALYLAAGGGPLAAS